MAEKLVMFCWIECRHAHVHVTVRKVNRQLESEDKLSEVHCTVDTKWMPVKTIR